GGGDGDGHAGLSSFGAVGVPRWAPRLGAWQTRAGTRRSARARVERTWPASTPSTWPGISPRTRGAAGGLPVLDDAAADQSARVWAGLPLVTRGQHHLRPVPARVGRTLTGAPVGGRVGTSPRACGPDICRNCFS